MKLTEAKTILVTDLMHIGDIVFITPFLHVLRRAAPQAKITLLADLRTHEVVKYNPNIDKLLTIDKKGKDDNYKALWNFAAMLRSQHYDIMVNLHPTERCSFLAAFSGAKYKVGVTSAIFKPWYDRVLKFDPDPDLLIVDMYLDILKQLGVKDLSHNGVEMYGAEHEKPFADEFYESSGVKETDTIIGFNVGGSWPTKRWLPEYFAKTADYYLGKGYKVVFFGGQMDVPIVEEIKANMANKSTMQATGKTTLLQLAALLKRCVVLISGDSGPVHVATTQKVPVVTIYGPSPWLKFPPVTDKKVLLMAGLDCQPCREHHCSHHTCMKEVTPEMVIDAVKSLTNL